MTNMSDVGSDLVLRRAAAEEFEEIIDVCAQALRWDESRPNYQFFHWKHMENAFGVSPIWVATSGENGPIVGVRTMMRWRLINGRGERLEMVRAVDTATLPAFQGVGIFSKLTRLAIAELTSEGTDAVFNTPNDKSRPGYLKLGWREVGKLTVTMRPSSVRGAVRLNGAKSSADKWGEACSVGLPPKIAFADGEEIDRTLAACDRPQAWSTDHSAETLRWRFGFEPLHYRVELLGNSPSDGFIVFRVRQRGTLRELDINEIVRPRRRMAPLKRIARIAADVGADVILSTPAVAGLACGLVPVPTLGPLMTWRPLASHRTVVSADLALSMGTVELF